MQWAYALPVGPGGTRLRFDPPCESVLARTSAAREASRQSRRFSCGRRLCCDSIDHGGAKRRAVIFRFLPLPRFEQIHCAKAKNYGLGDPCKFKLCCVIRP
jgi:hypothetical protein